MEAAVCHLTDHTLPPRTNRHPHSTCQSQDSDTVTNYSVHYTVPWCLHKLLLPVHAMTLYIITCHFILPFLTIGVTHYYILFYVYLSSLLFQFVFVPSFSLCSCNTLIFPLRINKGWFYLILLWFVPSPHDAHWVRLTDGSEHTSDPRADPQNKVSREPTRLQCGRAAWRSGETKQKPHISTNRRWSLFYFFLKIKKNLINYPYRLPFNGTIIKVLHHA